jgi:hypothetical protein
MRDMPARLGPSGLRGLRGSVVGLSAAGLGLLGHTMAGGALPSAGVVTLATAGLVLLGVAMSGREWGLPSLLTVLVGAQLAFHVVLAGGAQVQARSQMSAMPGMSHEGTVPGIVMTGVHVAVAVVAAVLLRRGELWCQALLELLGRPVRAVALVVVPLPRQRRLPAHVAPLASLVEHLADSLSRRGPPALSLT